MVRVFPDRETAGRLLGDRLSRMSLRNPVVLALPRGGVPVGFEIAKTLRAPLDLVLVRKVGVPWHPEIAAAAVVDGERFDVVMNEDVIAAAGLDRDELAALAEKEVAEVERRRRAYLAERLPISLNNRTGIVVDDGIATGATVRAALVALKRRNPARLVLAVPLAPTDTLEQIRPDVDDIVCLSTPHPFFAIGDHYSDFHQLKDVEVTRLLAMADDLVRPRASTRAPAAPPE